MEERDGRKWNQRRMDEGREIQSKIRKDRWRESRR